MTCFRKRFHIRDLEMAPRILPRSSRVDTWANRMLTSRSTCTSKTHSVCALSMNVQGVKREGDWRERLSKDF